MTNEELEKYQRIFEHLTFGGEGRIYHKNVEVAEIHLNQGSEQIHAYDLEDLKRFVTDRDICTVWVTYASEEDEEKPLTVVDEEDDSESPIIPQTVLITNQELEFLWRQVEVLTCSQKRLIEIVQFLKNYMQMQPFTTEMSYIYVKAQNRLGTLK